LVKIASEKKRNTLEEKLMCGSPILRGPVNPECCKIVKRIVSPGGSWNLRLFSR